MDSQITIPSQGRFPPQKGDVWTWVKRTYTFTGETKHYLGRYGGTAHLATDNKHNLCNWYKEQFIDGTLKFERYGNMPLINWNDWLPPKVLPDTGTKNFTAGQIWAFFDIDFESCVVRVERADITTYWCGVLLARKNCGARGPTISFNPENSRARRAILVADLNCEPTDPDLLYQFLY